MMIRIAVYCIEEYRTELEQGIYQFAQKHNAQIFLQMSHSYQEFLEVVEGIKTWDFVIVAVPGARGMEAVISAREILEDVPLLWCSDDADFAVASYRHRCNLFMHFPITPQDAEKAMRRCLGKQIAVEERI